VSKSNGISILRGSQKWPLEYPTREFNAPMRVLRFEFCNGICCLRIGPRYDKNCAN